MKLRKFLKMLFFIIKIMVMKLKKGKIMELLGLIKEK
jgi:hypothetical protein